jgi:hypothetical protein
LEKRSTIIGKGDHKTPHIIRRDDGFVDEDSSKNYFRKYGQFPDTEKEAKVLR